MQDVGLARNQFSFDDVRLALCRSPGVNHIAIFIFHHKFRSAKFFTSGDIRLGNVHLRGFVFHLHPGGRFIHVHGEDNILCNRITVR